MVEHPLIEFPSTSARLRQAEAALEESAARLSEALDQAEEATFRQWLAESELVSARAEIALLRREALDD